MTLIESDQLGRWPGSTQSVGGHRSVDRDDRDGLLVAIDGCFRPFMDAGCQLVKDGQA